MNVAVLLRNWLPASLALPAICATQLAVFVTVATSQFQILPGSWDINVPAFCTNCVPASMAF